MYRDRIEFKPSTKPLTKPTEKRLEHLYELTSSIQTLDQVVYPVAVYYRGVEVRILEVTKVETRRLKEYFVVIQLKIGNKLTKPFTITCTDIDDFIKKLRIEVIKLKVMNLLIPDTVKQL